MEEKEFKMEDMVNFCKTYGYIFQGSDIYGGLANTWDYGPLGSRLKNNLKDAWRKKFIQERPNAYELDADILMHPRVWEASGHVDSFADPLTDCRHCKTRYRADNLVNDFTNSSMGDKMTNEELLDRGVTKDNKSVVYLRPENAQGEYVNFLNVQRSMRAKIPFSIGQIGKAFRNEITPGNFIFRTIEFEQMEYQTFCKKGDDLKFYEYFKDYGKKFFMDLGLPEEKLRFHDHEKLAFYAAAACDIEYKFPFGWGEINGTHDRTDYDLTRHEEYSGVPQKYLDPETNEKYTPYIVESTYGVGRTVLALLCEAYHKETLENGEEREVLKLSPYLAPIKVAVLPLIKKNHSEKAMEIYNMLSKCFMTSYDESGTIGKRYRRADACGTPYCITIDDDTLNNNTVTIRHRDTMEQETLKVDEVIKFVEDRIKF